MLRTGIPIEYNSVILVEYVVLSNTGGLKFLATVIVTSVKVFLLGSLESKADILSKEPKHTSFQLCLHMRPLLSLLLYQIYKSDSFAFFHYMYQMYQCTGTCNKNVILETLTL